MCSEDQSLRPRAELSPGSLCHVPPPLADDDGDDVRFD